MVRREDFFVDVGDGTQLLVRGVRPPAPARVPVILIHGARVPGIASFDLPVPAGSLAADLAMGGHPTYVVDARGYGRSTRPPQMSGDPRACAPLVRSPEVVRDLAAVVPAVQGRSGAAAVAVLGWATGAMWAGHYATLYPDHLSHVVFYNSLYGGTVGHPMLGPGSDFEDPVHRGRFNDLEVGGYRLNPAESLLSSWDASIPVADLESWRASEVARAYVQAALDSDETSASRTPPSFRAPSGALEDSFYLACGRQLWDASLITAAALVIRSELDFWSRPEDAELLTEHLVHASRVGTSVLPQATHYVHLDRPKAGRDLFLREVLGFLAE
jgi:pimeloyl-ACP methyl ester carboxylesterase